MIVRKLLLLLMVCAIGMTACTKKPEDVIADVKKKYAEINASTKDYEVRGVKDITSAEGGTITGYYKGKEIKKMVSQHYTDTTRTFTEYYFDDGMLLLTYQQKFIYNKPISYTEAVAVNNGDSVWYDDKLTTMNTSRFYFHKNHMIKWVDEEDYETPPKTPEFVERESIMWAETVILLKQLKEAED